ncbi:MAG: hemerythrin domain-containing protein [Syntrophobacteraceae bacterium]
MHSKKLLSRRNFFILAGAAGAGLMEGCSKSPRSQVEYSGTAIEILERQHGLNRRALAILHKIKNGINAQMAISPEVAGGAVEIIRAFMIDCHQAMEEKYVFPVFGASQQTAELIAVLRKQHAAASQLTGILKPLCADFSQNDQANRRKAVTMIHLLTYMSDAHESWEDTVLFPRLRADISKTSYDGLTAQLEAAETQFFGPRGYQETIQKIAALEQSLGIANLASFTPRPEDLS